MAASHIFKVLFLNQGKVYEVYAKKVSHGGLFGFIELEDIVFGERSSVVLDPNEERIKKLLARLQAVEPRIQALRSCYVHFIDTTPLDQAQQGLLTQLLTYGPAL